MVQDLKSFCTTKIIPSSTMKIHTSPDLILKTSYWYNHTHFYNKSGIITQVKGYLDRITDICCVSRLPWSRKSKANRFCGVQWSCYFEYWWQTKVRIVILNTLISISFFSIHLVINYLYLFIRSLEILIIHSTVTAEKSKIRKLIFT